MSTTNVYLRSDVAVEPLVNRWYAWPYLLSPATGAMYLANSHMKLMQSFVATPQVHVAALKNPAMRGGPFIDYDATRAPELQELMEQTTRRQAHQLEFAEAVKNLDRILSEEATGASLEPLYRKVPEPLRGYVELVYDLNNHANIRFLEELLYRSQYYDKSSQSIVLSRIGQGQRPFVFSTPRLERPHDMTLDLQFASSALDALYQTRHAPRPLGELMDILRVSGGDAERFAAFFTEQPPRVGEPCPDGAVRVRYFGHACVLIEAKGVSILVDPVVCQDYDWGVSRYSYADLPPVIDYVLITHNHQDHCIIEAMLELRHRVKNVIVPRSSSGSLMDPSLKLILKNIGFERVTELSMLESVSLENGTIRGLPFLGEHGDLNIHTKLAYDVRVGGRSILLMVDSNNIEPRLYDRIYGEVGNVDVLFIGMECEGAPMSWLYGPLFTKPLARKFDQSRRLDGSNFERAAGIVSRFNPKQVYVYAMGQEPWLSHLMSIEYKDSSPQIIESNKLIQFCRERGAIAERPYCQKEILLEAQS